METTTEPEIIPANQAGISREFNLLCSHFSKVFRNFRNAAVSSPKSRKMHVNSNLYFMDS